MIAIDTNILVHAHREDSGWHENVLRRMKSLAEGQTRWAIPWPCIHEFLAIVTHPRIYNPPTPFGTALWSSDRDFSRFPELSTFNPLLPK